MNCLCSKNQVVKIDDIGVHSTNPKSHVPFEKYHIHCYGGFFTREL